jgi:hypothetical protein
MMAHSRPKHAEKRNKHTKKNCAPSWLYLQDYTAAMDGQQNIENAYLVFCQSVGVNENVLCFRVV